MPETITFEQAMQLASSRHQAGKLGASEFLLRQLLEVGVLDSAPGRLLLDILRTLGQFAEARQLASTLLEQFPRDTFIRLDVASLYTQLGNPKMAGQVLEKGLELGCNKSRIHLRMGFDNIDAGSNERAAEHFKRSLTLDVNSYGAYYGLARARRHQLSSSFLSALEAKLEQPGKPSGRDRAYLHFAKAYSLQDIGGEEYFHQLELGNDCVAQPWQSSCQARADAAAMLKERFTPELVDACANHQSSDEPIFIASMPRSGSTLLEQILAAHSGLTAVGESLAMSHAIFSAARLGSMPPRLEHWPDGAGFVRALPLVVEGFRNQLAERGVAGPRPVDKSMESFQQVALILLAFPNAKVIHLHRDPMDTVFSCFQQLFETGYDFLFDLEAIAHYYLQFMDMMEYWKQLFPGRIHTVSYEHLVSEQESATRALLDYCCLPWEQQCLTFYQQAGMVKTMSSEQVRQPIHTKSIGGWKTYGRQLQPAAAVLDGNPAQLQG